MNSDDDSQPLYLVLDYSVQPLPVQSRSIGLTREAAAAAAVAFPLATSKR